MQRTIFPLALAAAALVCLWNGQTAHAEWKWPWSRQPRLKESRYPTPVRMAAIWSPAVYNQAGQGSTRGFGGRLYFYDAKNQPVSVEGQLVVYVYNDTAPGGDNKPPEKKFAFTPEQFTQHYSPTELGASYSIWIPWDAVGQPQAELTLVPIFTSASGQLVVGETAHNLLPGPTTRLRQSQLSQSMLPPSPVIRIDPSMARDAAANYAVQQASYQDGAAQSPGAAPFPPPQADGLATMSITLPGTMSDRLVAAAPQDSPAQRLAMQRAILTNGRGTLSAGEVAEQLKAAMASRPAASPTTAAGPAAWPPAGQQPVRYAPPSPPARVGPNLPQAGGLPPSLPYLAAPQSGPLPASH
jgi:hypothetical protein